MNIFRTCRETVQITRWAAISVERGQILKSKWNIKQDNPVRQYFFDKM